MHLISFQIRMVSMYTGSVRSFTVLHDIVWFCFMWACFYQTMDDASRFMPFLYFFFCTLWILMYSLGTKLIDIMFLFWLFWTIVRILFDWNPWISSELASFHESSEVFSYNCNILMMKNEHIRETDTNFRNKLLYLFLQNQQECMSWLISSMCKPSKIRVSYL